MRKYFLYATCFFSLMGIFQAQANNELFPDLPQQNIEEQKANPADELFPEFAAPKEDPQKKEEIDLNKNVSGIELNQSDDELYGEVVSTKKEPVAKPQKTTNENNSQEKEKKNPQIKIIPHDITLIVPPTGKAFQFCTGKISLINETDYTLNELMIKLSFSKVNTPFIFRNVASQGHVTATMALMGAMCDDADKIVPVTIQSCKAEGISSEECKGYIKYVIE